MEKKIKYEILGSSKSIEVNLQDESVWLSLMDISQLFDRDKSVISRHIGNIYRENELSKDSTVAKIATVQNEGSRSIIRKINQYNLDVIISVGYRVKSPRGTRFRIWATGIIKQKIIESARKNSLGKTEEEKYSQLVKMIDIATTTSEKADLNPSEAKGILKVLQNYAFALETLDRYDHQSLKIEGTKNKDLKKLSYIEAKRLIEEWREIQNATDIFGNEKDKSFESSLQTIYQTFGGQNLYPSIEEKAANLLYFIVKNHSFTDGNKRIAAGLFIYFLDLNNILYNVRQEKRIGDNALVAITIMIAESKSEEKEIMIKLIVNLINDKN